MKKFESCNVKALCHVVRVLENVPEENFSIVGWANSCGTVACAVGWAGQDNWFREQGFKSDGGVPSFKTIGIWKTGWDSVEEFFKIDFSEAEYLFAHWMYPNHINTKPIEVINRIKEVLGDRYEKV